MSSIFELFDVPEGAGDETGIEIDPANLDSVLDRVLKDRPVAGRPDGFAPGAPGSEVPTPDGEVHGTAGEGPETSAPVLPEAPSSPSPPPAAETPPAPVDPFAGLSEIERLELMQYRQALADPDRALAVKRAILGVPEAPAASAAVAPPAPAAPTLPEDVDPGSFEATLWQQNQEMMAEIRSLREGQQASQEMTEQERMNAAAQRATQAFVARYGSRLSQDEIAAVAQHAGLQKLPEAFRPVSQTWDEAMDKSLEFVLRSNDGLLAKVLGGAAPAPPPAPGTRSPEAVHRGRQLTALSSAASPSGEAAQRVPIESRGDGTGKMSEKSRLALVQEMLSAGSVTGTPGEGI